MPKPPKQINGYVLIRQKLDAEKEANKPAKKLSKKQEMMNEIEELKKKNEELENRKDELIKSLNEARDTRSIHYSDLLNERQKTEALKDSLKSHMEYAEKLEQLNIKQCKLLSCKWNATK